MKINELSKHLSPEVTEGKINQSEGSNNEEKLMKKETYTVKFNKAKTSFLEEMNNVDKYQAKLTKKKPRIISRM